MATSRSRETSELTRPAAHVGGRQRGVSYEFDPLSYQMDHVTTTDEQKRQCRITVAQQVVLGRLSKTEARQVLLALGLA